LNERRKVEKMDKWFKTNRGWFYEFMMHRINDSSPYQIIRSLVDRALPPTVSIYGISSETNEPILLEIYPNIRKKTDQISNGFYPFKIIPKIGDSLDVGWVGEGKVTDIKYGPDTPIIAIHTDILY
jgi:hypothetical protein